MGPAHVIRMPVRGVAEGFQGRYLFQISSGFKIVLDI